MIRKTIAPSLDHDPDFEWRGHTVTRIENLSDIVFALAMGMAVLSSDIPQTYEELQSFLLSFIPAFLSFILLLQIWFSHFTFFRRYGIADTRLIIYNVILLFFVLFLAYPLRFAFEGFFNYIYGFYDGFARAGAMHLSFERSGYILGYFCAAYAVINFCFFLMYRHITAKADILKLTEEENIITRGSLITFGAITILAIITGLICSFTPIYGFGGWLLCLNWPLNLWVKKKYNPKQTLPQTVTHE